MCFQQVMKKLDKVETCLRNSLSRPFYPHKRTFSKATIPLYGNSSMFWGGNSQRRSNIPKYPHPHPPEKKI